MNIRPESYLVSCVDFLKRQFRCRTYYIENVFVALCLAAVVLIFGRTQLEWIGALAVFFTFSHASVGFRLEEQQALLLKTTGHASVECFYNEALLPSQRGVLVGLFHSNGSLFGPRRSVHIPSLPLVEGCMAPSSSYLE